ncbi:Nuclear transcription factor Y subunit C-2 [Senna tora]|uniref:Nuclear transcription factor Y subunit C-2 n=1 Tax=Senna tora TaxID=362788 RepID=A0A834TF29_9FABA|nr:Nuclear transcription factor Y subunit C-2 [Senna tora]
MDTDLLLATKPQPYSATKWYVPGISRGRRGRTGKITGGRKSSSANKKVIWLGGRPRRVWRMKGISTKLRLMVRAPLKVLRKLKNGYVDFMVRLAGNVGSLNSEKVFGGRRIPKARQVGSKGNYSSGDAFEARLIYEISKILVSSNELHPIYLVLEVTLINLFEMLSDTQYHASQNVLGDFGSTENFNQQPLTDFSNIINQPPFQQVPEFMTIPPYMLAQYRQEEDKNKALEMFWKQQMYEIQNAEAIRGQNQLPLARIKRIMKSDSDVKMVSAETPILLSKACEMFIQEMSLRAWMRTEENKRRTIQRHDVAESIHDTKLYDFLTDVIPLQYQGGHPSLVPPPQPQEEQSGQAAENPNYAAPIVDESLMNMGINVTDQQAESSQQYTEAFTMDPSIAPPHPQFPYNFPPPN